MEMIPLVEQHKVVPREPTSNMKLYSGVPWDNQYRHVRKYNNREELNSFLDTKVVAVKGSNSVIRVGKATLRMSINEYDALNCNYCTFFNPQFDNRTHYAFITAARALSDKSTEIDFELDVWNENQFNLVLNPCFIERMIVPKADDVRGRYTYPEGIEYGEDYLMGDITTIPEPAYRQYQYVLMTSVDPATLGAPKGKDFQGMYSGIGFFSSPTIDGINSFISVLTDKGKADGIMSCFQMPQEFFTSKTTWKRLEWTPRFNSINGYVPKNKKLFCYPYYFFTISNNQGGTLELKYEMFKNNPLLRYTVVINGGRPVLYVYALNYMNRTHNYDYSIQFTGYPQCAVVTDFYKAYMAQNSSTMALKTGMSIANTVVGAVMNPMSAVSGSMNVVGTVLDNMNQKHIAQIQPGVSKSTAGNGENASTDTDFMSVYHCEIRYEYAKKIDDFFSMFGYKINEIRTPDISSRSSWNYVKTVNCSIAGVSEHNDLLKLREIFDNGVTVWHTNDVGNYGLSND